MIGWLAAAALAAGPAPSLLVARGTFAAPSPDLAVGVSWWAWRPLAVGAQWRHVRSEFDTSRDCKGGELDCLTVDRYWKLEAGLATFTWSVPGRGGYVFQWFNWNVTATVGAGRGLRTRITRETTIFNMATEDVVYAEGPGPVFGLEVTGLFGPSPGYAGVTVGWTTLPGVLTTVTVGVTADLVLWRGR
jgi:hypothetical protein